MEKELRVLILEDTSTDAELIEHELRKAGLVFISKRVDTQATFTQALDEFRPDIVLSDYHLPEFDGLAALKIMQREHAEVPVIMVTGALPDIEAVELIHAGARDYVLKDRLARLAPAVQRALSVEQGVRARKAAENALRESEEKFRSLVESTSDWIWEINELAVYTYANPRVSELLGYSAEEIVGKTPYSLMTPDEAARMQAIFGPIMVARKPFRLLENTAIHKNGKLVIMEASGTPVFDGSGNFRGYRGINRDITERRQAEEERQASAKKLEQTLLQTIAAVAATVETRDPYTAGHQRRVTVLVSAIAKEMNLAANVIRGLDLAATIHDLGKLHLPAEILSKPGKLLPIEFELIKSHPEAGYNIIKDVQFPWPIAQMVRQHHERLDGSGYPQGLKGDQIMQEARILAVADVVEAMSSHRPYRPALGVDAALEEISNKRGLTYDPAVVDVCIGLFREKGFSF